MRLEIRFVSVIFVNKMLGRVCSCFLVFMVIIIMVFNRMVKGLVIKLIIIVVIMKFL